MNGLKYLKIGDAAPSFSAIDQHGKQIDSSLFAGKKLAVYFYPKDNTPGCTAQACNLRDNYDALIKQGISIVGVSADSIASHQKFSEKFSLPFSILVDEDHTILKNFGVWGNKKFMGKEYDGIHRTTFLINEKQTIIGIIEKPKTKAHAEEISAIFSQNE
jgi:peroxiredoxin Q/BCP